MLFDPNGPELTRETIEKRLEELKALPDAGALARRLRKQRGLSMSALAEALDVRYEDVRIIEMGGRVRLLRDYPQRGGRALGPAAMEPDDTRLDRFLELLEPSQQEREVLLQDLSGDIERERRALFVELVGLDFMEDSEPSCDRPLAVDTPPAFADPWSEQAKPKKRKRRRERVAAVSPLHAVGPSPLSTATRAVSAVGSSDQPAAPDAHVESSPLRYRLQLVSVDGDGQEQVVEVAALNKSMQRPEHVGLTLAESKRLLRQVQRAVVEQQVAAYLKTREACTRCGKKLGCKDHHGLVLRTLFGNVPLVGPRKRRCRCSPWSAATHQPLRDLLPENTTPELLFMESKWASLVSYGMAPKVLKDLLPVDDKLNPETIRRHTMKVAERCEDDLKRSGENADGSPASAQPQPQDTDHTKTGDTFNVGIDGAYLRRWKQRGSKFEVLIGRSAPPEGPIKCFGMVHTIDADPPARLREVLRAQGMQPGQCVRFMADGDDTLRTTQGELAPQATHLLDWFHVTMRLTVLRQYIKGVVKQEKDGGTYGKQSVGHALQCAWTSTKWKLWHGKTDDALDRLSALKQNVLRIMETYPRAESFRSMVDDFRRYIVNNRAMMPDYGKLWRDGISISTASIESLVCSLIGRRFAKKQQMQWTPTGAHKLLQVRVKVANGDLPSTFQRWYPDFPVADHQAPGTADSVDMAA